MRSARPELPHVYGVAHGMLVKVAKRAKKRAGGATEEQGESAGHVNVTSAERSGESLQWK
jgi:hypothetical protein